MRCASKLRSSNASHAEYERRSPPAAIAESRPSPLPRIVAPPGTGKSHLAQAIGRAAILQGYRVVYREAHTLLEELAEATLAGTRKDYLAELATVPLLIVDDLGMRKLAHTAAEDLLELIMRRYERASTLLTSNRPVDDWGKLLGDTAAVTALLDRLLHHAHVLKCGPRSWRTKVHTDLQSGDSVRYNSLASIPSPEMAGFEVSTNGRFCPVHRGAGERPPIQDVGQDPRSGSKSPRSARNCLRRAQSPCKEYLRAANWSTVFGDQHSHTHQRMLNSRDAERRCVAGPRQRDGRPPDADFSPSKQLRSGIRI